MADVNTNTGIPDATGQQAQSPTMFTQEQVNAIISQRLNEERSRLERRITEQYGDPAELLKAKQRLEELEAASLSETEKLRKQLADLEQKAAAKEREAQEAALATLRLEVGQSKGLPPNLAKRLNGATRVELEADADAVLADLKLTAQRPSAPNLNATAGAQSESATLVPLTAGQIAAARAAGLTDDQYRLALKKIEAERKS